VPAQPERSTETRQQGPLAVALEPIDLVTSQFLESHDPWFPFALMYVRCSQSDVLLTDDARGIKAGLASTQDFAGPAVSRTGYVVVELPSGVTNGLRRG
jgi:hypothetical protein